MFHHEVEVLHDCLAVQFLLLFFTEVACPRSLYYKPCHAQEGDVYYSHDHPEHGYLTHEAGKYL